MVGSTALSMLSSSSTVDSRYYSYFYKFQNPRNFLSNSSIKPFKFRRIKQCLSMEVDKDSSPERYLPFSSQADFTRFEEGGSGELQTAIVSYRKKFPSPHPQPFLQVDLVSLVHIGERKYYAMLQKELQHYDCVLHEMLVSREGLENLSEASGLRKLKSSVETTQGGFNVISFIQRKMARILMLESQVDCLDYKHENWYHADLDLETFKLLQIEKGQSLFSFASDMIVPSAKAKAEELGPWRAYDFLPMPLIGYLFIKSICGDLGNKSAGLTELQALSKLDVLAAMRIFLAKGATEDEGPEESEVTEKYLLTGDRNRAAMEALKRAINLGHNKIAILYGGGHMPDLARRLRDEFDLVPSKVQWFTAWSIKNPNLASNSFPFLRKLGEVLGWPLDRYQTVTLVMISSVVAVDLWLWQLVLRTIVDWITHVAIPFVNTYLSI